MENTGDLGEPLQIKFNREALERVVRNLKDTGVQRIAIVSVMGAYRTGKSFLLDLFLRYLRHAEKVSGVDGGPTDESEESAIPAWVKEEGDVIVEGRGDASSKGFLWRGGMDKVTEGLWMWSRPYILRPANDSGETPLAVLLLDSQGAFDSKMTREQSSTIFGLTAVLSSLQIYNVSMQLQEDKIESLHYFMECANSCMRFLTSEGEGGNAREDNNNNKSPISLFQHLEFLIRDWPNFEPEWTVAQCEAQMKAHLAQHMDEAVEGSTSESLKAMFERISCFMFPHPGLKVNKVGWSGKLEDVDVEFFKYLNLYVHRVFDPKQLKERCILNKPVTPTTLVDVVETFINAFKGLVPKGENLATAIARSTNLLTKEQVVGKFKIGMEKFMHSVENNEGCSGEDKDEFEKFQKSMYNSSLEMYNQNTLFGSSEIRNTIRDELISELQNLSNEYKVQYKRLAETALNVFSGLALLVCILYLIDKISDFTCDWYSDTCVRLSNALFLVYFLILVGIMSNAFLLYQSRGQAVTLIALIELGKSVVSLFATYYGKVKQICTEIYSSESAEWKPHLTEFGASLAGELKKGSSAMLSTVAKSSRKRSIES